jgi:hypothetical protein
MIKFNRYYHQDTKTLIRLLTESDGKRQEGYHAVVNTIGGISDVQKYFEKLRGFCDRNTRVIVVYYNHLWEPIIKLAEAIGLKEKQSEQNWLVQEDIVNILTLTDFKTIKKGERLLLPIKVPLVSDFVNKYVAKLPVISSLCLTRYIIARPINFEDRKEYSVSVIVPARNEEGTVNQIIPNIPEMGVWTEVVFVEGRSKDKTWEAINAEKNKYSEKRIQVIKQQGIGKADAVRTGIIHAKGDIIMILDADLSVHPSELPKFYKVLAEGRGEFVNGSRMVYPKEHESMRLLNQVGNKFFSVMFTWILQRRFTDTLCGTKTFFRADYLRIMKLRKHFGDFDPFGDFELIFGATKLNLDTVEIPVRYRQRTYGKTNISRFTHGWLLMKMLFFAIRKFKWSD